MTAFDLKTPRLVPFARYRWDKIREQHQIVYPEGVLVLNRTGAEIVQRMDRLFEIYSELARTIQDYFRERHPKSEADSDFVYRQAIRAKAFDAVRGILPAAALSNVGIYGSGQGYEALLLRMRAPPLPEARRLFAPEVPATFDPRSVLTLSNELRNEPGDPETGEAAEVMVGAGGAVVSTVIVLAFDRAASRARVYARIEQYSPAQAAKGIIQGADRLCR